LIERVAAGVRLVSTLTTPLLTTPLTGRHHALSARMAPFAGYDMPIQYAEGVLKEHLWTRASAGLFDVSHMGPCLIQADDLSGDAEADHARVCALIEPLICGDIVGLKPGAQRYTLLLNDAGGIDDDLMVARPREADQAGTLNLVVNAGCKEADFARIEAAIAGRGKLVRLDSNGLLALQGPLAVEVFKALAPGVENLTFMQTGTFAWDGEPLGVSRSGYTGEDGFEILVRAEKAAALWDALLADERVKAIGLGARDSLRLEAGLPLYGHDLDATTSPVEAGLGFALSPRRRAAADFPGATRILAERDSGPERARIALVVEGAPAREGAVIADADGAAVGVVTSGGFSPSLGKPIAIGFASPAYCRPGAAVTVVVRDRRQHATVVALPFVPHRYVRQP
jgi:aminomethyltransferase